MNDTYQMPEHGWTCFFCGETFTKVGAAENHFGGSLGAFSACQIKAGAERGILMALRKAENELARYRADDIDIAKQMATMQSRHADALRVAEELGYERGLRDAKLQPVG